MRVAQDFSTGMGRGIRGLAYAELPLQRAHNPLRLCTPSVPAPVASYAHPSVSAPIVSYAHAPVPSPVASCAHAPVPPCRSTIRTRQSTTGLSHSAAPPHAQWRSVSGFGFGLRTWGFGFGLGIRNSGLEDRPQS
eukprot:179597-Rhodomonas_salina.1